MSQTLFLYPVAVLTLLAGATHAVADPIRYTITDVGAAAGSAFVQPYAINSFGEIVGLYDSGKGFSTLGSSFNRLGSGAAISVNDSGAIAYYSNTLRQVGINDQGTIIGDDPGGRSYTQVNGTKKFVGPLIAGGGVDFKAINNSGQVVGAATAFDPGSHGYFNHPILYSDGKITDLGLLPGDYQGEARAINSLGQVVGLSGNHAFLYEGGKMFDLGSLGGGAQAESINNLGQIVGSSDQGAFLYEAGQIFNLNGLIASGIGLRLLSGVGINNRGQIAVSAVDADGNYHALRLDPLGVPEPATVVAFALIGDCCLRRAGRRRHAATR